MKKLAYICLIITLIASCKNSKANCDAYSNIKNKNNELSNIQFIKLQDSIKNLNKYIKFLEKDNNILNSILSQKEFNENNKLNLQL